ncbi:gamma carbonic anhydrase family protein [Helicobacter brantae]|uniref:Gamma carbonic anhydrase family protein n=1 Tax=Helicobacter brantae TaxID=375927 RepID=A0A3D8J2D3_9HELI|nr:gamma carbonic anhydrase family protein [Helicobacter brantae]RDU71410.1 gamma carbonic anhydrase family protein [Helicobacter brantae]
MRPLIIPFKDKTPNIHKQAFIFPQTSIIGDVRIEKECSVWFGSVIRGDVNAIFIDEGSNIQELTNIHVDYPNEGKGEVRIGKFVTIGHRCIIHACEIGDRVLVGMGSIIMDRAVIGSESIIGANSLITKGKTFPPRSLIMGNPAKLIRELSEEEIAFITTSANHYISLAREYESSIPSLHLP